MGVETVDSARETKNGQIIINDKAETAEFSIGKKTKMIIFSGLSKKEINLSSNEKFIVTAKTPFQKAYILRAIANNINGLNMDRKLQAIFLSKGIKKTLADDLVIVFVKDIEATADPAKVLKKIIKREIIRGKDYYGIGLTPMPINTIPGIKTGDVPTRILSNELKDALEEFNGFFLELDHVSYSDNFNSFIELISFSKEELKKRNLQNYSDKKFFSKDGVEYDKIKYLNSGKALEIGMLDSVFQDLKTEQLSRINDLYFNEFIDRVNINAPFDIMSDSELRSINNSKSIEKEDILCCAFNEQSNFELVNVEKNFVQEEVEGIDEDETISNFIVANWGKVFNEEFLRSIDFNEYDLNPFSGNLSPKNPDLVNAIKEKIKNNSLENYMPKLEILAKRIDERTDENFKNLGNLLIQNVNNSATIYHLVLPYQNNKFIIFSPDAAILNSVNMFNRMISSNHSEGTMNSISLGTAISAWEYPTIYLANNHRGISMNYKIKNKIINGSAIKIDLTDSSVSSNFAYEISQILKGFFKGEVVTNNDLSELKIIIKNKFKQMKKEKTLPEEIETSVKGEIKGNKLIIEAYAFSRDKNKKYSLSIGLEGVE